MAQPRPHEDIEPNAEMREGARGIRQMYVALMQEGFNDHQALIIVGQVLAAVMSSPPRDTGGC